MLRYFFIVNSSISLVALLFALYSENYQLFQANYGALGEYAYEGGAIAINEVSVDLSGLTYSPVTDTIFAITNSAPRIIELNKKGGVIRQIDLDGFEDTEAIVHVEGDLFAVALERKGEVVFLKIDSKTEAISRAGTDAIMIDATIYNNRGLEGLAYDKKTETLYTVKERSPRKIYAVSKPFASSEIVNPWDAESKSWFGTRNLSGLFFYKKSNSVFVLSRASKAIIEYTAAGEKVGQFILKKRSGNLPVSIDHAEGITMDLSGTLYVVAEPNLFFYFKKRS